MENLLRIKKMNNQAIICQTQLHWFSYIIPFLSALIGFFCFALLFLAFQGKSFGFLTIIFFILFCRGIFQILYKKSVKLYVTEGYLTLSTGILSNSVIDISLDKMKEIQLYQNWLGEKLSYGTLVISTGEVTYKYSIKNPKELREVILNQTRNI